MRPHAALALVGTVTAAAAGCAADRAAAPRAPLVAALGDSITAGSPLWDPDPRVRAEIGPRADPRSSFEYWAPLRLRNCGVFGERTDEIARRLASCARGALVVVLQGGINDIAQGRAPEAAAASLARMVAAVRARGARPVLVDVLPWDNGYPRAAPAIAQLNRQIAALARRERVTLLPFSRALADPSRPGRMRPALTVDGDHPSIAGYRRLGALVTRAALGVGRETAMRAGRSAGRARGRSP